MIKSTQIHYDISLWERKQKLHETLGRNNVTFQKILIAGIEALEGKVPKPKTEPDQFMHDTGELVPEEEPQKELKSVPNPEPKPETRPGGFLFYLDLPSGVAERKYDIYDEIQGMWVSVPFETLPNNTMFRIRDDGYVIALNGKKHFYKDTDPIESNGTKKLLIYPAEYAKKTS